jgi:hypothetical protein
VTDQLEADGITRSMIRQEPIGQTGSSDPTVQPPGRHHPAALSRLRNPQGRRTATGLGATSGATPCRLTCKKRRGDRRAMSTCVMNDLTIIPADGSPPFDERIGRGARRDDHRRDC